MGLGTNRFYSVGARRSFQSFFCSPLDFFFGLQPVVELRARFTSSLDVEFVRPAADTFFDWKRLNWGFCYACGGRHGLTSRNHASTDEPA